MAAKYLFKVFDQGELKSQVITDISHMTETLDALSKLGLVKGYIIFDKDESEDE